MMGSTKLFRELDNYGRVMLTKENAYTVVRVLYEMGIVVMPGWAVVMSEENGKFFTRPNAATGVYCAKSEVAEGGVCEATVIDRWKIGVLGGDAFGIKGMENIFIDAREVCGESRLLESLLAAEILERGGISETGLRNVLEKVIVG
jgi:hypothetical protein